MPSPNHFLRSLLSACCFTLFSAPSTAQTEPTLQQFVYVLRVAPRLHDPKAWTDADNRAVAAHFKRLQQATEARTVLLAGRTREPLPATFGLVIFEARSIAEAQAFMEADPAVKDGVMTAELHPYAVALMRK